MRQQGHRRAAEHHFNLRQRTGRDWPDKRAMLISDINLMPHRLRTAWTLVFRYFLEKWLCVKDHPEARFAK
jgi:hypothetical protein